MVRSHLGPGRGASKRLVCLFFFFNDTATTEIYTLSLHDALPIFRRRRLPAAQRAPARTRVRGGAQDRKSTRLNSSHGSISYAVFCLEKQKQAENHARLEHDLPHLLRTNGPNATL